MIRIVAVASLLALTGCATSERVQMVDTSCDWVKPIYVSKKDVLTDKTASDILVHDKKWKTFCGNK
jgi:hypothetical protein